MKRVFRNTVIFSIKSISAMFRWNQLRACRFYPSCSEYSILAFQRFGVIKAFWLSTSRIVRCHPFSRGGYDPLVDRKD